MLHAFRTTLAAILASLAVGAATTMPAAADDYATSPNNPGNPNSPLNMFNPANPLSPNNPANLNNPSNLSSPLNPANQYPYGYGYGYGYGGANPTIVGLAFWTGRSYSDWACQLGVDFQCPSSPNYAYRRAAAEPAYDEAPPVRHRHKRRHRSAAY